MSGKPNSGNIKILLLFLALIIAFGTLYYTQSIVKDLQERQKKFVELYAKSYEYIISTASESSDFTFLFENIIKRIDFPIILTNAENVVNKSLDGFEVSNLAYDSTKTDEELMQFFADKIESFDRIYTPIAVEYGGIVLSKIHYGDSDLINSLKYYPFVQIIIAFLFIIIGYVSFSYIKKTEQSNIWVGMAKETAHQLGTPISSLLGWTEILRMNFKSPDKVLDATEEMGNDLSRLEKIAQRFSKIGSTPKLVETDLNELFENVINYFKRRIPQARKNVELVYQSVPKTNIQLNKELFEWVLENLIKNALDAIESNEGKIELILEEKADQVNIYVKDNGKGLDFRNRKDIFRPGYSTKKRGWGLGLSLAKRIVEDYHKGKIILQDSAIGRGSVFLITLKK
ncbi:MAG: HAMP domain-containing histidine kinase [Melioribacteraceae bacterium]|nr:HAMP domain-containing histidine kinase [Melioribacteraceae bacterium]